MNAGAGDGLIVEDLGRASYAAALEVQRARVEEVLRRREAVGRFAGFLLMVEHDPPVITVSRRPGSMANLTATPAMLERAGVEVAETDRGGDITYHGPGQLVVYPILDLNALGLNLHAYIRLLEQAAIEVCAGFGVRAARDPGATGVWVGEGAGSPGGVPGGGAKVCAIGVRVRRWVTMHGLALNVTTNLDHFGLIVPCGLAGRPVTSLERLLGAQRPAMDGVKRAMDRFFRAAVGGMLEARTGVRGGGSALSGA